VPDAAPAKFLAWPGAPGHAGGMKVASTLLALLCVVPAFAKAASPPEKPQDKIVVLEPMKITGSPIISFPIDLRLYSDPDTQKVDRIFITKVWPGTDAEAEGLKVGDEIVKVDGKSVKDFEARVSVDSPLGQVFLNRKPGDTLKLEILTQRMEKITLRAQRPSLTDFTR